MKKFVIFTLIIAMAAGAAFAVDVSGEVIGTVTVLQGDSKEKGDDDPKVFSGANMDRIRIQGEGETGDGKFFGWVRLEGSGGGAGNPWDTAPNAQIFGNAGWKPIDQFKIWIGGNGGDGFFGKDGHTRWMFYQRATDPGVTFGGANAWAGSIYGIGVDTGAAFFGGNGQNALRATISPMEMVNINLELPFFQHGEPGDVFKALVGQVDLNFDFGNIALTYVGDAGDDTNGKIYGYFNLGAIDKLGLDVGFGIPLPADDPKEQIAAGLGVRYAISDEFGIKFRTVGSFGGEDTDPFKLLADVLPYYAVSDNLKIFLSAGLGLAVPDEGDSQVGFHINPYVWVGQEWGPSFWAGFKLSTDGVKGADDKSVIKWEVPIAIGVSF